MYAVISVCLYVVLELFRYCFCIYVFLVFVRLFVRDFFMLFVRS